MAKDPAYLMYPKSFDSDTKAWDADEVGYWIRLLNYLSQNRTIKNDLETIASVCGVKFSNFDRFSQCYKRTLKPKLKQDESGNLYNEKLRAMQEKRAEYAEKQVKRGTIGAFIKRAKAEKGLNKEQSAKLYKLLESKEIHLLDTKEKELCYKHTLKALLVDVNVIVNKDLNKDVNSSSSLLKDVFAENFTTSLLEAFNLWIAYKKEQHKFTYKPTSLKAAITSLGNKSSKDANTAIEIINTSIENGWKGFFELDKPKTNDEPKF